jgi:sensor histidine kinase YesM
MSRMDIHAGKLLILMSRLRFLQHLVFWGLAFYILLHHFASSSEVMPIDAVYTLVFMLSLLFAVYVNLLVLMPRWLERGNFLRYGAALALLLWLSVELHGFSFNYLVDRIFPGFYLISYFDRFETLRYVSVFLAITSLLHLSKSWIRLRKSESVRLQLEREKSQAELNALKVQVNPHFLFNTLNSIYSLISPQNGTAREAVLKLADSMRYIIYESNQPRVPVEKELEYLRNYIELQRLRSSAKDRIEYKCLGEVAGRNIAPLLILPLVENAFKHGIKGETGAAFVYIRVELLPRMIRASIENNPGSPDPELQDRAGGFGLDNLRKRLELEYPARHRLQLESTETAYKALLEIW